MDPWRTKNPDCLDDWKVIKWRRAAKSGPVAQSHRDSGGKIRRIKNPDVQCHDKSIFGGWNFGRLATDKLSLNSLLLRKGLRNACLALKETFNIGKWQEPQWHGKVATNQTSGGHSISAPHFIAHLKPVSSKNSGENPKKNCPQWQIVGDFLQVGLLGISGLRRLCSSNNKLNRVLWLSSEKRIKCSH